MSQKRKKTRRQTTTNATGFRSRSKEAAVGEWDAFYVRGRLQWRSSGLGNISREFLRIVPKHSRILEIGCGVGDDAEDFISLGFKYDGIDFSSTAISEAEARLKSTNVNLIAEDFFRWKPKKPYALVYEKGVLHGLGGVQRRRLFAYRVASVLVDRGVWITVAGSADDFRNKGHRGALFLTHLVEAVEPYFEILQIVKGPYGLRRPQHEIDAWYGVFRRR